MKTLLKIIVIAFVALSLTSCDTLNTLSLAGHAVGGDVELKSIAYDYETDLALKSELMSACATVGTELGYKSIQQTPELISWEAEKTNKVQEYFGKHSSSSLFATIVPDGATDKKTLRIGSYVTGNYSDATQSKVDSMIINFEGKLRANLEKSNHYLKKIE